MRFVATARVVVEVDPAAVVGPGLTIDSDLVARAASTSLAGLLGERLIEVTEIRAPARDVGWVRRRGRLRGQVGIVYAVAEGRVRYGYRGRGSTYDAPVAWWYDNFSLEVITAAEAGVGSGP